MLLAFHCIRGEDIDHLDRGHDAAIMNSEHA